MGLVRSMLIASMALVVSLVPFHAASANLSLDQLVQFDLVRAPLTPFQKKRLPADAQNLSQGTFSGKLRIPVSSEPIPAVVLFHTCHGDAHYASWVQALTGWGIATLSVSRCQPPDNRPDDAAIPSLDWKRGALVAFSALKYLRTRPEVKGQAVVVMGWSRLGAIPLSVLNYEGERQFFKQQFAAGIALYPFCSFARGPHAGPLLVISAGRDDYVDPGVCERMVRQTQKDRFPAKFQLLPDAWHGFDLAHYGPVHVAAREEINPDGFAASKGTVGYDAKAHKAALSAVRDFLQRVLGKDLQCPKLIAPAKTPQCNPCGSILRSL